MWKTLTTTRVIAFVMLLFLAVGSGVPTATAQDPEQSPLCESLEETRDLACAAADAAEADAETNEERLDAMKKRLFCMRLDLDYFEWCEMPG